MDLINDVFCEGYCFNVYGIESMKFTFCVLFSVDVVIFVFDCCFLPMFVALSCLESGGFGFRSGVSLLLQELLKK